MIHRPVVLDECIRLTFCASLETLTKFLYIFFSLFVQRVSVVQLFERNNLISDAYVRLSVFLFIKRKKMALVRVNMNFG